MAASSSVISDPRVSSAVGGGAARGPAAHLEEGWYEEWLEEQQSEEAQEEREEERRRREQREELRRRAENQFSWIPDELFGAFQSEWVETGGSAEAALAAMRQHSAYEQYFAGNLRDDGTVRLTEQEYMSTVESYEQSFSQYGVPTDVIEDRFPDLIRGNVRPEEVDNRLDFVYSQVASRSSEIRNFYREVAGINASDSAIFTSVIRPDISLPEIERRVRKAQIGGTASEYDFNIAMQEARRLEEFGLDRQGAQRLYSEASRQLPQLQQLIDRHEDPNDEFSLRDYTDALVFEDADQMRTIERLFSTEQAQFLGDTRMRMDQETGGVRGLRQT